MSNWAQTFLNFNHQFDGLGHICFQFCNGSSLGNSFRNLLTLSRVPTIFTFFNNYRIFHFRVFF